MKLGRLLVVCLAFTTASIASSADDTAPTQKRELRIPTNVENYTQIDWPKHFQVPAAQALDSTPADNPTTDAGATLGRALFYDTRLSVNGRVSCGSCHVQQHAFSDPERVSAGHSGRRGDRNSMSLVNLRFLRTGLFWDERIGTLEEQVLVPMASPVEMGHDPQKIADALGKDEQYLALFEQAFGKREVSSPLIAKALSQFIRSLVSYQSKYDAGLANAESMNEDFANFTAEENAGKALFKQKCSICHQQARGTRPESFEMFASLNNGVNVDAAQRDGGQGDLSLNPAGVGLYRASSLRNIEKTAPYMHDGRFATLEEVVNHYSEGVHRHPTVSPFVFRMRFKPEEKRALIAFLKTLTDDKFLNDPKFSDPWVGDFPLVNVEPVPEVTLVKSPAAGVLTAAERAERVSKGLGLSMGDAIHWLKSLDADLDGKLTAAECDPLVKVMLKTGGAPRLDTRRFNRNTLQLGGTGRGGRGDSPFDADADKNGKLTLAEAPEALKYQVELADLNGDGMDAAEQRRLQTFQRLFEVDDGGRDFSRGDRFVDDFGVGADKLAEAKASLTAARKEYAVKQLQLNTDLSNQLAETLGSEKYDRFRDLILARPEPGSGRNAQAPTAEQLLERVMDFDRNESGALDEVELQELATILDESPGGFGQMSPAAPTVALHVQRLLAYGDGSVVKISQVPDRLIALVRQGDVDGNGGLTEQEAASHLRKLGFDNLLRSGVYIGGGFGNVFGNSSTLVDRLELSEQTADQVKSKLDAHRSALRDLTQATVSAEYHRLRASLPVSPTPQTSARTAAE